MGKLKDKIIRALGGYTQPYLCPPGLKAPVVKTEYNVQKVYSVCELKPWMPESVVESGLKQELINQIDRAGGILYDRKVEDGFTKVYATAMICVIGNCGEKNDE